MSFTIPFHELAVVSAVINEQGSQRRAATLLQRQQQHANGDQSKQDSAEATLYRWLHLLDGHASESMMMMLAQQHGSSGGGAQQQHGNRNSKARRNNHHLAADSQPNAIATSPRLAAAANTPSIIKMDAHCRSVRIFVSSTFTDMSHERDLIMTRVAPRIAQFCESIGVTASFVDLRWGVTSEQSERHDTVQLCLSQVLQSQIVLFFAGDRYGWNACGNTNNNNSVLDQHPLVKAIHHAASSLTLPWLDTSNTYLKQSSVTELELRCALQSGKLVHAFLRESTTATAEKGESPEAQARLASLRKAAQCLPSVSSYKTASSESERMEEELFSKLKESILQLFPAPTKPRKWERENSVQMARADQVLVGFAADV